MTKDFRYKDKSPVYKALNKRHQVWLYDREKWPTKEEINSIIKDAYEVTPSKQQFMPYKINIIGPGDENQSEKIKIWNKVVFNHHATEDRAMKEDKIKDSVHLINRNYQHILSAPYVLVFETRVCKNNKFNQWGIDNDSHFTEQTIESELKALDSLISFECGLFCHALTGLAIEKDIDVSFTSCYPKRVNRWKDTTYVNIKPQMILTMGYGSYYRMDFMRRTNQEKDDHKPPYEDIINWVDVAQEPSEKFPRRNTKNMWDVIDDKKFTDMVIEKNLGAELEINRQLEEEKNK